ncbi:MAG: dethiobiotin synthase [Bacillota bacterium]
MLSRVSIPGLFITGTDTGVGKTVIAGAIAQWFHAHEHASVGACKIAATGCVHRREGLVSEDAEFIAQCGDVRHPLDLICPQRYTEPLAPAVAAERAKQPLDWEAIDRSIKLMSHNSDVMVVEGVGGIMVPMDPKHTVLDVAEWLGLPTVVVARPALGTINHTLLTVAALRSRQVPIAGVVINRYPTDTPGAAEETSPRAIEKWGKVSVLCIVPDDKIATKPVVNPIPPAVAMAVATVDWGKFARGSLRHS